MNAPTPNFIRIQFLQTGIDIETPVFADLMTVAANGLADRQKKLQLQLGEINLAEDEAHDRFETIRDQWLDAQHKRMKLEQIEQVFRMR